MNAAVAPQSPDPSALHPIPEFPRVMFVRNLPELPANVEIGEYTYYDDPDGPEAFRRNVLYHYEFLGDRLVIGRFTAMAAGTKFIMNGGNHRLTGVSTYPFSIFAGWRGLWEGELDFPSRGDTVVVDWIRRPADARRSDRRWSGGRRAVGRHVRCAPVRDRWR